MPQEIEKRLEDFESRIEKKIDDARIAMMDKSNEIEHEIKTIYKSPNFYVKVLSVTVGIVTALVLLVGFYSAFSVQREISKVSDELAKIEVFRSDFQNEAEKQFRKIDIALKGLERKAKIELYAENGNFLDGETIPATILKDDKGQLILRMWITLKNNGNKSTDPMFVKMYFNEPFAKKSALPPTDVTDFDTEQTKHPETLPANGIIPSGLSWRWNSDLKLAEEIDLANLYEKPYPFMIKVYYDYANNVPAQAKFFIKLNQ